MSTETITRASGAIRSWPWVTLNEACKKITDGTHHSPPVTETGIPYITAKHLKENGLDFYSDPWFVSASDHETIYSRCDPRPGDVLYIKDGATTGRAAVNPYEFQFSMLSSLALLRCDPLVCLPRYLSYWLNNPFVRSIMLGEMSGAAIQRLTLTKIKSSKILLPPLTEQRRTADILDRAQALRIWRRATLDQLDKLSQSLFLDAFGEKHSEDWETVAIADIADKSPGSIRTGPFGSQLLHSEFAVSGIAVLGIDNVVTNEFRWTANRFVTPEKYQQLSRYTVKPGDVLVTIMGTCGRCAIVPQGFPVAINTKHICCITPDPNLCSPEFLKAYFLLHPVARRHLEQSTKGAIMDGLNMAIIKATPIPLAPLPLQQEFARQVQAIDRLRAKYRQSLAEMDALFLSLQHRAFRGEL